MTKQPIIIGFAGFACVGKSTCARYLERRYGFVAVPFANPIKTTLLNHGLSYKQLYGSEKELEGVLGHTPRFMMETLGMWGRSIHHDYWVKQWERKVDTFMRPEMFRNNLGRIVVEDVRFINEVNAIQRMGGLVIHVHRDGIDEKHLSEREINLLAADADIFNDSDRQSMVQTLDVTVRYYLDIAELSSYFD